MFAPKSKPGLAYAAGATTTAVKSIAIMNFFINRILLGWIKSDFYDVNTEHGLRSRSQLEKPVLNAPSKA